jgi:hypothetical protein
MNESQEDACVPYPAHLPAASPATAVHPQYESIHIRKPRQKTIREPPGPHRHQRSLDDPCERRRPRRSAARPSYGMKEPQPLPLDGFTGDPHALLALSRFNKALDDYRYYYYR